MSARRGRSLKPLLPVTGEVRIPITKATAAVFLELNRAHQRAQREVEGIEGRIHDHVRCFYTEHGIEDGRLVEVTEAPPYELVVVAVKAAKES